MQSQPECLLNKKCRSEDGKTSEDFKMTKKCVVPEPSEDLVFQNVLYAGMLAKCLRR